MTSVAGETAPRVLGAVIHAGQDLRPPGRPELRPVWVEKTRERAESVALFVEFVVVIVASALVAYLFMAGFDRVGPWGVVCTFLVLFLATWAIGAWTGPLGPSIWNVYWLPYLIAAAILGALFYLVIPPGAAADTEQAGNRERVGVAIVLAIGGGFWLLLIISVLAIVLRYVFPAE
jgi:hypothetical protein